MDIKFYICIGIVAFAFLYSVRWVYKKLSTADARLLQLVNEISKVKIVANLPYYITTPIIMTLLEDKLDIESITVMVQKEVAKRLTANPGEKLAGAITYAVNYYCEAKEIVEA